jgi:hypothetical protein
MIRLFAVASVALAITAVVLGLGGPAWDKTRELSDRIVGAATTTPGPTSTATALPLPTATPTPTLPANSDGLHRWDKLPVHYCIAHGEEGFIDLPTFQQLTDQAFAAWGVPTVDDGICSGGIDDGDHVNEIGFGTPPGAPPPGSRVTEAGLTLTTYSECTANCEPEDPVKLVEADIIIEKTAPREFRSRRCLYSTLLHETGHFLGLNHLPAPAVMEAQTSDCPQQLTQADIDALLQRYGARAQPSG